MSEVNKDVQIVSNFLEASMAPDPVRAATFMSDDVKITFTGGAPCRIRKPSPLSTARAMPG